MSRTFLILAAVLGLLAVLAGTFGAHGLRGTISDEDLAVWHTASQYHMYHALALLGVGALSERWISAPLAAAGWLFTVGIVVFAGSLYLLALSEFFTGKRHTWLGMVTPIGGLCFILGWASLLIAAWRSKSRSEPH